MSNTDHSMPKFNMEKDASKLSKAQHAYMKLIEQQNLERVQKLAKQKRGNLSIALLLGAGALSIYGYSIYSVKQEHFLDEME